MKILKRVGLAVVLLLAALLVAALFVPKQYTVERSISIALPKDSVFAYVKYLRNQNDYSKWASMDPGMKKEFRGTDAEPGFVSAWESKKDDVGIGEQTIRGIDHSGRIDYELHFIKPMDVRSDAWMITEAEGAGTKVRWGFKGEMPYPFNLMLVCTSMKESIAGDLDTGLANLKTKLEAGR